MRPTLVLLHGWTATADLQWFMAYAALAERYRFVAIDHRGHGRGMRSVEPFTLEAAADDVAALVGELDLGRVILVGYSMGGPIALHAWSRHRERVAGLVLEATALEWRSTWRDRVRWWFLFGLESALRSRLTLRLQDRAVAALKKQNAEIEPWLPWIAGESRRGDATAITDAGRALRDYDARSFVTGVEIPAGVLVTTKDQLVRPAKQRALARAVHGEIVALAGDHLCFWAQPAEFSAATRRLVDLVAARVAARGSGLAGRGSSVEAAAERLDGVA
jgi:3-oxoadipate enol-lactonase